MAKLPLVFIHGFKGSRLLSPKGELQWVGGLSACGLQTPALSLPLGWTEGIQDHDSLRPDGPLEKVKVIPRLVEETVYGPWLDFLRSLQRPVHVFSYDWRRNNEETVLRFSDFIEKVRKQHHNSPVRVVAHSMGGLITLSALHQGLEGVESILFAGVPFRGGIGFLDDLHAGKPVGLNRAILSPDVLSTFPSVYTLFPLKGADLLDSDGNLLEIDLFDPQSWRRHQLGPYRNGAVRDARFNAYFDHAVKAARQFRETLYQKRATYPQIEVVVGTGRPTLGAISATDVSATEWDVQNGRRDDGDARVRSDHALPPDGIPFDKIETTFEHAGLLNDPSVMRLADQG